MKKLDKYLVPLSGISIIFFAIYKDLMGTGSPGLGKPQIILILVGMTITIVGLKLKITPILFLKNLRNVDRRTLIYISAVSIVVFLFMDLLLGWIFPKIHTPTKYGWSVVADRKISRKVQDTKDNYRIVSNQYFAHGFKRWPTNHNVKPRVLVIGDSFTQMTYVNNGEEWYAYLEREFSDIAFFIFGAGGYGTLQEYMVMDDHFDEISPDAIIWQFCSNDSNNNYFEQDKRDYPFNNHFVRPYWENDGIVYRLPLPYPQLRKFSFFADKLLHVYDRKRWRDVTKDRRERKRMAEKRINNLSPQEKRALESDQTKSINITKYLIKKVRSRAGNIPIYFFNPCRKFKHDRSICEAGDFRYLDFLGDYLKKLEDSGIQIRVENDGHWNYNGNKYAGEKLAEYFKNIGGIIPSKR